MEMRKTRANLPSRCFGRVLCLLLTLGSTPVCAQNGGLDSELCGALPAPKANVTSLPYTRVEDHLIAGYQVKPGIARQIINAACNAGIRQQIDPLLVLAVVSVETSFNPHAKGWGESRGLMQVVASAHPEKIHKFGGAAALDDIQANLMIGTWVLKEYLRRDGSVVPALQRYNGSRFDKRLRYSKKVINAYQALCYAGFGKACQV